MENHSSRRCLGGIVYIATFHDFSGNLSFHDVWDTNCDGKFGDGISPEFNSQPTFWLDGAGAEIAREQIITELG